jgi:hypothetical protein
LLDSQPWERTYYNRDCLGPVHKETRNDGNQKPAR